MDRPTSNGYCGAYCTTPGAAALMSLLGAELVQDGVAISPDEKRALDRLYGYVPEKPNEKPPAPIEPKRGDFNFSYQYDGACRVHKTAMDQWHKWEGIRLNPRS